MARAAVTGIETLAHLGDVPDACPYLPDRVSTLRFVNGYVAGPHYRELLDEGYRRSGHYMYRPVCRACNACQVLRVPVATFKPSKEQRRVWNRCAGVFEVRLQPVSVTPEKVAMYRRYQESQHGKPDPAFGPEQYEAFLVDSCLGIGTFEMQVYRDAALVGVGILDRAGDALSSVYFYFDPSVAPYSLGTWSALKEIELAREWGFEHYYLGYYIEGCQSMAYKARFRPCEIRDLATGDWTVVER